MMLRALTRHVLNEAIAATSTNASINDIERILKNISSLNLLLSPNTVSSTYRFNSQIIPQYLAVTSLDRVRDNLENMLRIFDDIQDRKESRIRNILIILLSAVAIAVALIPYLIPMLKK
jgi:hypothetical protein